MNLGGLKIKIVHICQEWNSNYSYQENVLPFYHQKSGNEVVVLTSEYSSFNNEKKEGIHYERGIKIERLKTTFYFKHRFVIFKNIYKELEKEKPDYIFFHGIYSPDIPKIIKYKKKYNCKFVLDNHADLDNSGKNIIWRKIYYENFLTVFHSIYEKYIDKYFGVTPKRCRFLAKYIKIKKEKIELLPLGTDTYEVEKIKINKEEFLKKYSLENLKIISFGGKITPNKKFIEVVEAFLEIKRSNAVLIIFGEVFEDKILELYNQNKDKIILLGWQNRENTLEILKNSYMTIWPWAHTTLIEDSISTGTPIIYMESGNTEHLIGEKIERPLKEEIKKAILKLLDDENYYNQLKDKTEKLAKILSYNEIEKISLNLNDKNIFMDKREKLIENWRKDEYPSNSSSSR